MDFSTLDALVFFVFVATVLAIGFLKSRDEKDSESYFLAGRGLSWWLIGFSLIAANISTEQFVGMSGQAANYVGLAIASYEWMAAITLVFVGFFFLPKFLRAGIYTIPEYLEHRFDGRARTLMAVLTMVTYVTVTISAVIYSGALTITTMFDGVGLVTACWIIGLLAAIYVATGGLKACAWADLLQGSALIVGGGVILWYSIDALAVAPVASLASTADVAGLADAAGGWEKFFALNDDKLHMALPASDQILPWTALAVGLWIPNFYYWGLNQYIVQRTLGSHSLAHGQKGIVFAAGLKLLIPFVIVFPGMIAFNLFSEDMAKEALPDNQQVLTAWAAAQEQPDQPESLLVVEFDQPWAERHPEQAVAIAEWNDAVKARAAQSEAAYTTKTIAHYKYDTALGLLIGKLIPPGSGLQGFILAALLGAVVSSLASMLNAASTIFTMDLFRKYLRPDASQSALVLTGRICVMTFMAIGALIAPILDSPEFGGVFTFIQEFQGFISPGILAVFLFGLFVKKAPRMCGMLGLLSSPLFYGVLQRALPDLAFLDRMAVTFGLVLAVMTVATVLKPRHDIPAERPTPAIDLQPSRLAQVLGTVVVATTVVLYAVFW